MVTLDTLEIINSDLNDQSQLNIGEVPVKEMELAATPTIVHMEEEENEGFNQSTDEPDVNDSEHMKSYLSMFFFYETLLSCAGLRVRFDWKWTEEWRFMSHYILTQLSIIFIFYTVLVRYLDGKYVEMIEPLVILGITVSVKLKYATFFTEWKTLMALFFNYHSVCRRTKDGTKRAKILTKAMINILKLMKACVFMLIFAVAFYLVVPIKVNLFDKERMSLLPIEIPFLDQVSLRSFIMANMVQMTMGFFAAEITSVYAVTFIVIIGNYLLCAELLSEDFKNLDEMWDGKPQLSVQSKRMYLWNICKKRQDMQSAMRHIKRTYETILFYYIGGMYINQIVSLYQITINHWIGGVGPCVGLFGEMGFYCFMGTLISIADDKLCFIICDTNWYKYDLVSQRIILMLLRQAQCNNDLQIGFIGSLNLNLYIQIIKSIYSYYTILSEVL